ncbi:hypothetical protein AN960_05725 [Bacillus sp. FJAT-25509]|nr:hypothetical protein AN960_05725 [Bacillus sp. FJAT-25509]
MGLAGRLRPRRNERDEEAQVSPHGKRASCSGNQHHSTPLRKFGNLIDKAFFNSVRGLKLHT